MSSKWKQGDLVPTLTHTMKDCDGNAIDLTTATGVVFQWRLEKDGSTVQSGTATVVTAASGDVEYQFQAGETDVAGHYKGQFVATFPAGEQTSPVEGFISFSIEEDL